MLKQLADRDLLDGLIDELEQYARMEASRSRTNSCRVCLRRHARHPFRLPCLVRCFVGGAVDRPGLYGRTRNLSRCGIGLLVPDVFSVLEPIELEILPPARAPTFLAGLVRFCRYAGRGYHEVGMELRAAGPDPILSRPSGVTSETMAWIQPADPPR